MQLAVHIGAHFTEEDRLAKCLLRNKGNFAPKGITVPGPGKYRDLLRQTLAAMDHNPPADDARDILLDAMLDDEQANRIILSNANFAGPPRYALAEGRFYVATPRRLAALQQIFHEDDIEVFLAIRDPATYLPALCARTEEANPGPFLHGTDPRDLRWSALINKIRTLTPDIQLTVWCNEDLPLIWEQVLREIAALPPEDGIAGSMNLLSDIMQIDAFRGLKSYFRTRPNLTGTQKRRAIAAFLEKFALPEKIEEELDIDGWNDDLVEELTDIYEADVERISRIPGVRMITP